jgi:chromate transporter
MARFADSGRRTPRIHRSGQHSAPREPGLLDLAKYFLWLGATGFGGPVALVDYMHHDLVERRRWFDDDTYRLSLAFSQLMPGPLAVQLAVTLSYFRAGLAGASVALVAFVLPPLLLVLALSVLYVQLGGLWWMQALFYGVGATSIGIIALAAQRLASRTVRRDVLLWAIFLVLVVITAVTRAELGAFIVLGGIVVLLTKAPPDWLKRRLRGTGLELAIVFAPALPSLHVELQVSPVITEAGGSILFQMLVFFAKAGTFAFGSGLATIPFLEQGVVRDYSWLTPQQFLDAVPMMVVSPGPALVGVAFMGYLVAGFAGAAAAAIGIFTPVYVMVLVMAPWFRRHRHNPQLAAFVQGATAAAAGAIAGSVLVLAQRAIVDVPTALIGLVSLGVLWRFRVPEPLLVLAAACAGLLLWPLSQGVHP